MGSNSSNDPVLESNCRQSWPTWTCICGNVCGLSSTTLWFLVLLPQVWKNFRRKSVKGLSVLWATANFTASLVNLFFVFKYAKIPLYGQISSIYCPILEFMLLVQFWVYGNSSYKNKIAYLSVCVAIWAAVLVTEFITTAQSPLEYIAIALWCIETFPQVILNMRLQSTSGQSFGSVLIATFGKTTDFCSNNILVIPIHYVIMTYFSSSVAFVNGFQVALYYGNDIDTSKGTSGNDAYGADNAAYTQSSENNINSTCVDSFGSSTSDVSSRAANIENTISFGSENMSVVNVVRYASMALISCFLISFVAGFVWNVGSFLGLLAPVAIIVVVGAAKLFIDKCDI